jgi:serine/threonine protein phosphatase PrpC
MNEETKTTKEVSDVSDSTHNEDNSPKALFSYDWAILTDQGKVRSNNEDWAAIEMTGDSLLMVLADGMAGHQGGEVAAQTAVESVDRKSVV